MAHGHFDSERIRVRDTSLEFIMRQKTNQCRLSRQPNVVTLKTACLESRSHVLGMGWFLDTVQYWGTVLLREGVVWQGRASV